MSYQLLRVCVYIIVYYIYVYICVSGQVCTIIYNGHLFTSKTTESLSLTTARWHRWHRGRFRNSEVITWTPTLSHWRYVGLNEVWQTAQHAGCKWLGASFLRYVWGLSQNSDTPASTVVAVQSLCHAPAQERNQAATWGCIPHHVSGSPWSHLMSFIWLIVTPKKIEINSPLLLDWIVWFYLFGDCY